LQWHRNVGIAIVALALLSAATGTVLVFRSSISTEPPRVPPVEHPVALDAIVAAAVAAGDGSPATDVELPLHADAPYIVWLDDDDETEIYLDGRARVVGRKAGLSKPTRFLFRLHTGELLGPFGTALTVLTGLGILLLGVTGLTMSVRRRSFVRVGPAPRAQPEVSTDDRAAE